MNLDAQKDMYREQMSERHANGIPVVTFESWQEKQALLSQLFAEIDAVRKARLPIAIREKEEAEEQAWADGPYGRIS